MTVSTQSDLNSDLDAFGFHVRFPVSEEQYLIPCIPQINYSA
jgi:hypothetical protein